MLSRRVKNQIYRMIAGILLLPFGPILLFYNEVKVIQARPIFQGYHEEWVYWVFRLAGYLFITVCLYRIFSTIKLFMMKIPLTYNEIRAGIYVSSFLTGLIITLVCISIVQISHQPIISLILIGLSIVLMTLLLIRRGQKKKEERSKLPSVKPQQAKDV
jgi:hypothetical protein